MASVALTHRHFGNSENSPLILLHGLLGSSRNWLTVARDLTPYFDVYALDLRNHGTSPHTAEMDYEVLVEDVVRWLDDNAVVECTLLGHSMGGKTAMALACRHPQRVSRLIVADIAPKDNPAMLREFDAMGSLNPATLKSLQDADRLLEPHIPNLGMRRFLLTNLERNPEGGYHWTVNLPSLTRALATLALNPLDTFEHYAGETLFIRGGRSDFVPDSIWKQTTEYFPRAKLITLPDAGHNVHVDDRKGFVAAVCAD